MAEGGEVKSGGADPAPDKPITGTGAEALRQIVANRGVTDQAPAETNKPLKKSPWRSRIAAVGMGLATMFTGGGHAWQSGNNNQSIGPEITASSEAPTKEGQIKKLGAALHYYLNPLYQGDFFPTQFGENKVKQMASRAEIRPYTDIGLPIEIATQIPKGDDILYIKDLRPEAPKFKDLGAIVALDKDGKAERLIINGKLPQENLLSDDELKKTAGEVFNLSNFKESQESVQLGRTNVKPPDYRRRYEELKRTHGGEEERVALLSIGVDGGFELVVDLISDVEMKKNADPSEIQIPTEVKDKEVNDLLTEARPYIKLQGDLDPKKENSLGVDGKTIGQRLKDTRLRVEDDHGRDGQKNKNPRYKFSQMIADDKSVIRKMSAETTCSEDGTLLRTDLKGKIDPFRLEGMDKRASRTMINKTEFPEKPEKVVDNDALIDAVVEVFNIPRDKLKPLATNPKVDYVLHAHITEPNGKEIDFTIDNFGVFEIDIVNHAKG